MGLVDFQWLAGRVVTVVSRLYPPPAGETGEWYQVEAEWARISSRVAKPMRRAVACTRWSARASSGRALARRGSGDAVSEPLPIDQGDAGSRRGAARGATGDAGKRARGRRAAHPGWPKAARQLALKHFGGS